MSGTNIDYKTTNFEYPNLTKISGQPDYELLKLIKDELKANAGSVPSNLGGVCQWTFRACLTRR